MAFGDDGDGNEWAVGGEAPLGPGDLLVLDSAGASEIGPREERGEAAIGRGPGSTIGPAPGSVYHTPESSGNARPSVGGEPPWAGMRAETEVFVESDE